MDEPLIRDIPQIKKTLEDAKNFSNFNRIWPVLRPVLKLMNVDVEKISNSLDGLDDLIEQIEELASLPDRFNDAFADHGWIIYDLMNVEVAKKAVKKTEAGDLSGAETILVDYYSVETVRWKLGRMRAINAFRPRMALAQKALVDYEAERYHACIPVVLALLDGLVNELHEKRRGFFAEEVDLKAWDSIAAHSRGLNVLTRIFQKGRYKTTTEQITIPYRNGILHGMDLGYDNKTVAAKTWAALFAVRDWASKSEQGLLEAPPEESKKTWGELFQQIRENAEDKKRLQEWQPRKITVGVDIPVTGEPSQFDEDTPERKLAEYLTFWQAKNYGYMAKCLSPTLNSPNKKAPKMVRDVFDSKRLRSFSFVDITDVAAAVSEIQNDLVFEKAGQEVQKSVKFSLVNVNADGSVAIRGKSGGYWIVRNWQVH